jgi:hypothetical protein
LRVGITGVLAGFYSFNALVEVLSAFGFFEAIDDAAHDVTSSGIRRRTIAGP